MHEADFMRAGVLWGEQNHVLFCVLWCSVCMLAECTLIWGCLHALCQQTGWNYVEDAQCLTVAICSSLRFTRLNSIISLVPVQLSLHLRLPRC